MDNNEFKELVLGAIDKLEKQGVPSKMGEGCFYLDKKKGHCCIVGHMMPDDETRKAADDMPNGAIYTLWEDEFEWALQFHLHQLEVLSELQKLHDDVLVGESVVEACQKMREVVSEME